MTKKVKKKLSWWWWALIIIVILGILSSIDKKDCIEECKLDKEDCISDYYSLYDNNYFYEDCLDEYEDCKWECER